MKLLLINPIAPHRGLAVLSAIGLNNKYIIYIQLNFSGSNTFGTKNLFKTGVVRASES